MIGLEDRRSLAQDIDIANTAGARLHLACSTAGIDLRTLQRWKAAKGLQTGDGRPSAVHPTPSHALSEDERAKLLEVANEPRFAAVPPARIVPMLADEGVYIASESSFSRVLRAAWANRTPWTRQGAQGRAPTHDAYRQSSASGLVLGHDLFTCRGDGVLVSSVPDPGLVQPQDRGLGGA